MKALILKAATVLGSRVLTRAAQVVAFIVLARVLSPAGFGVYGILTSAVFLSGQLGNLGLRQAAAYRIGQKTMPDGDVIGLMLVFWPVASAVCAAGVVFFNNNALAQISGGGLALTLATSGVLFTILFQGVFLGRGEIHAFSIADAGPRILQSVIAVLLWLCGMLTLPSSLWGFAAGFVLLCPLVFWLATRESSAIRVPLGQAPGMVRHGLAFAAWLLLVSLQPRIGVFFVGHYSGAEAAGTFFAAQRACEIFLDLATAVGLVLFSDATRKEETRSVIVSGMKTAFSMSAMFLVGGVLVSICSGLVIKIVLGNAYAPSAGILAILALGLAPAAAAKIMNGVVGGAGLPWISAGITAIGVAVNIAINWILAENGGVGAAVALVSSQYICAGIYILYAAKIVQQRKWTVSNTQDEKI